MTPVYPPYRGGIGTVAAHDARRLREQGVTVDIFTPAYRSDSVHEEGVHRLRPFFAWGNGAILFQLLFSLKKFDVLHLHYPFFGSDILAAFASMMWRIPLVVTYHMQPKASGFLGVTFQMYRRVFQWYVFRVAKRIFVSSEEYAKEHDVHHSRLIAMPFGVDTERFMPGDRLSARTHFGLAPDVPTILFVGGLDRAHYFKGVDIFLRACKDMKTQWQLLIVGDGDQRCVFEDLTVELGISDRVHFAGSVPFGDLPLVYQAADVHVLPSIDRSEAFGIVTLEAMASGVPSIVSDLPGVRTLVTPNETGERVPPGDVFALTSALDRFCGDMSYTRLCGERAREKARVVYDDRVLANQLRAVYNELVSNPNVL